VLSIAGIGSSRARSACVSLGESVLTAELDALDDDSPSVAISLPSSASLTIETTGRAATAASGFTDDDAGGGATGFCTGVCVARHPPATTAHAVHTQTIE
jgi:hypothetical protein